MKSLTGLVLAGGASQRMGRDKAFLELGGRSLIEIVVERMASVCAEVLIVAGDARPYTALKVPVIEDRFPGVGVLGGLHAGLEAASHNLTLVVGCDMPFLNPDLLRRSQFGRRVSMWSCCATGMSSTWNPSTGLIAAPAFRP